MRNMIILFALTIIVAGCANGYDEPDNQTTIPNQTNVPDQARPIVDTQEPSQSGQDINRELTSMMRRQVNLNYHVDYDSTIRSAGIPEQRMRMSYYMQGADRMRVDITTDDLQSRSYMMDDKYTVCTLMMDAWNCMNYDLEDEVYDDYSNVDNEHISNIEQGKVSRLPPRTIAGVLSSCFRAEVDYGTMDYCYTPDGIPVYMRSESDYDGQTAVSEMTATRISTSIPQGTFDLPVAATTYDDMDIADIMNQYGMS
jgi:hypothetical protein